MVPRQYLPFSLKLTVPLIVYPVLDENPLGPIYSGASDLEQHLADLYSAHMSLKKCAYHILFCWNLEGHRMTDVWIHAMENWSDSGPLIECLTFRDLEPCDDAGIASGDSLIVLGREEELRRSLPDLECYIDRSKCMPTFPAGMQPNQEFN